ncbi:hypothetical protein NIES2111_65190 (plasmid) [Nostoc sp. NIES-2111]|nr:hypothetical protein NIES2111_65190 [Nostoc sp. NIES-2111]
MPRNLEICNQEDWFLREDIRDDGNLGYPIYYRFAITYSIAINIIAGKDKSWMSQEINRLIESVNNNKLYEYEKFIELHPLAVTPFEKPKGFVLVDQTDSYYPLMFYGDSTARDRKPRVSALKYSLLSIKDGLEDIYDKLSELRDQTEWTFEFQNELWELFPGKPNT